MPRTQVERAFGTQAQIAAFTPASGEFIYDSDRKTIVVGDAVTLGGFVVAAPHISNTFSQPQTIDAVLNMNSHLINNVTNPVGPQDAATKAYSDAGDAATLVAAAPPFTDTLPLVKGSVTATKLLRFEVDGFTAATTRVLTPPNADITLAGINISQIFAATQTITPAANTENLILSGGSLTGANAQSALDISSTWNTAGDPIGLKLNVTNTASGASALLFDLQKDALSRFQVRKSGFVAVLRQEADVSASSFELTKRGTTGNALAALSNGSAVGAMLFRGYDGTAFGDAGSVRTFTTQAWAVGAHGTQLNFNTVPVGSAVEATHATLTSTELAVTSRLSLPNTTSATVGGIYFGGVRALHNFGTNNIFGGVGAGNFTLTGTNNAVFGNGAGVALTSGGYNSFFGRLSGAANTTGVFNSFFGFNAGAANTSGTRNSIFGLSAGQANTTGSHNCFFGYISGLGNTTGTYNSFFGRSSGQANTSGGGNCFFGASAGTSNTTGVSNNASGNNALRANTTGNQNNAMGFNALFSNTTGDNNNAVGGQSLVANTTGASNSAVGFNSLASNTTGVQNNAYGGEALFTCIVGDFNNALGFRALFLTTGSNNIAFGQNAGDNLTTGSNNIFIGHLIDAPVATGSNQLSIGNLIFGTGVDGTGTTISSGNVGVAVVTPTSGLHLGRSFATPYRAISGADTFAATDYTINVTANTFTLNLPTAVGITGRIYVAKNSGAGVVTLDGSGAELIDGLATQAIAAGASLTVQSTGAGWIII